MTDRNIEQIQSSFYPQSIHEVDDNSTKYYQYQKFQCLKRIRHHNNSI